MQITAPPVLLFFKANAPASDGGLLPTHVEVAGYTTRAGTRVAPHRAIRHKKTEEAGHALHSPSPSLPKPLVGEHLPDLFSAAMPPKAEPSPPEVPKAVKEHVRRALGRLVGAAKALEHGRSADKQFDGGGRYEHDAWQNTADDREHAHAILSKFRERAAALGIDPEVTVSDLGGEPQVALSDAAQEWTGGSAVPAGSPDGAEHTKEHPDAAQMEADRCSDATLDGSPTETAPEPTPSFEDAIDRASAAGPFTPEALAGHWRDHSVEDALDMLHARLSDFALHPDGKHWQRMQDYLDSADPVDTLRDVMAALENPETWPYVKVRLRDQARRLTEHAIRERDSEGAPASVESTASAVA